MVIVFFFPKLTRVATPPTPYRARKREIRKMPCFGDRCDWTTGGPHNGNEWKKYLAHTPRPRLYAYLNRSGTKRAFSLPGAMWDHFRCAVEPSPGHIRCRSFETKKLTFGAPSQTHLNDPPGVFTSPPWKYLNTRGGLFKWVRGGSSKSPFFGLKIAFSGFPVSGLCMGLGGVTIQG